MQFDLGPGPAMGPKLPLTRSNPVHKVIIKSNRLSQPRRVFWSLVKGFSIKNV